MILLVGCAMFSKQIAAQLTSGSIIGVVYDSTGAVVVHGRIAVVSLTTGAERDVETSDAGFFTVPSLPPDQYSVTVNAAGFQTTKGVVTVTLGSAQNVDFHLALASSTETVQVDSAATGVGVDTSSHDVAGLLSTQSIENLPSNGRDLFHTLQSLPSVAPFQNAAGPVSNFRTAGNSLTIGGSASGTTTYLQDGVTNFNMLTKTANLQPPIEATQEVSIIMSGASARFDEPSVVNVITKNGTNRFHGRLYDYFKNDALNTRGYFNVPKPPLRYNQFGANFGGPLIKSKLFFFLDYSGLRSTVGTTLTANVATAAERKGDFSSDSFTIYDPATYNAVLGTISAFPGNIIPASRLSNFGNLFSAYFPLPTGSAIANTNFQKTVRNATTYDSYLGRLDYTIGAKDSIYSAYEKTNPLILDPSYADAIFNYRNTQSAKNAYVQETHVFSERTLNVARFGYNNSDIFFKFEGAQGSTNYVSQFGLSNLNPAPDQYSPPAVTLSAHTGLGNSASPQGALQNLYQLSDEINLTRGKHYIYAGIGVDDLHMKGNWVFSNNGSYNFNGQFTSNHATAKLVGGSDLADFLLGYPSSATGGTGVSVAEFRQWNVMPYIQDDWRISEKLTLNLGIRYDYYGSPSDKNGHSNIYDIYTNTNHPGTFNQNVMNFAPRFGFAYAPSSTMSIHGGYGIYYSPFQYNQLQFLLINQPNFFVQQNTYSLSSPTSVTNTFVANPTLSAQAPFTVRLYNPTPYVQQYSLAVQKSFGSKWLATVSYLGNKSDHLQIRQNPNQASLPVNPASPTPIQTRRPYSYVGDVFQIADIGYGTYNALQAGVERRFSNGLSFNANFVYSKSLDALNNGANTPQYGPNVQAEYGLSDFNPGKVFKASGVYRLPIGTGQRFLGGANFFNDQVIGGWQVSGILTSQSGLPFNATASDLSNTGGNHSTRANQICNGNRPTNQSKLHFFNTSCYVQPGIGTLGSEQRDNILGPRTTNLDASLSKAFPVFKESSVQFRVDFFDVMNHPLLGIPVSSVTSPTYGQITNVSGSRIVQLSLKIAY